MVDSNWQHCHWITYSILSSITVHVENTAVKEGSEEFGIQVDRVSPVWELGEVTEIESKNVL